MDSFYKSGQSSTLTGVKKSLQTSKRVWERGQEAVTSN